mmetsp:Transcript_28943/g.51790  ORF Transcript_28943/g.51790 Transcript_28943/m.51790 type:complete len:148 (+) Transcript_28943:108-551(+)
MVRARPAVPAPAGGSLAVLPAAPAVASGGARGVRRDRPAPSRPGRGSGTRPVDREIKRLQQDHHYLSFSKVAFSRLVRDVQSQFAEEPYRWSAEALMLFQVASEEYLTFLYADAQLATSHRHRVTLSPEDLRLVRRLRQPHCWGETR